MANEDNVYWIGSTEIYLNEFNVTNRHSIRTAFALISGVDYYQLYLNRKK